MSPVGTQWALDVVDAAYRMAAGPADWLQEVVDAARVNLDAGLGLTGSAFEWRDGQLHFLALVHAGNLPPGACAIFLQGAAHLSEEERQIAYGPAPGPLERFGDLMRRTLPQHASKATACADDVRATGIVDFVGACGFDGTRRGYVLAAPHAHPNDLRGGDVAVWRRVRPHLLAGLRLHTSDAPGEAVLEAGGRVVHAEGAARSPGARAALREASVRIDRARSTGGRRDPEAALMDWQGLVSGRWSLVDRFDTDGRRYIIARRNDPALGTPRPLSARQQQVLVLAALGRSNKEIAYELGLAPSTVSSALGEAMRRLRIRGRAELADLWRVCGKPAQEAAE